LLQESQTRELLRKYLGTYMLKISRKDDATRISEMLLCVGSGSVERGYPIK